MTSENNETIVFRHGAHSLMLGLALFAIVGAYAIFALSLGLFGGLEGSRVFAPKNTGAWNYLVVPYLLIVIYALNRIRLGVFRKPMAEISSQGIRVHRLLSQRFMAWAGVAAVEVVWGNTIRVADLLKNPDPAAFGGFRLVPKNWDAWKNPFIEIAPRGWGVFSTFSSCAKPSEPVAAAIDITRCFRSAQDG